MPKLTAKQEAFAQLIAKGENQSDAYRAVYSTSKTTAKSIHELASKLCANTKVASRIAALRERSAKRVEISTAEILQSAARAMLCDPRAIIREDGTLVPPTEWPDEIALAIDGIDIKEDYDMGTRQPATGRTVKLKFSSRTAARDQLMKYAGLYQKDNEQRAAGLLKSLDDLPDEVLEALEDKVNAILRDGGIAGGGGIADLPASSRTAH